MDHKAISAANVCENTDHKLRFRKFPWEYWTLGGAFFGAGIFIILTVYEHLISFKKKKIEYALLAFLLIVGFAIIHAGKIKTISFNKKENRMTLSKTNLFCCRRSKKAYTLSG